MALFSFICIILLQCCTIIAYKCTGQSLTNISTILIFGDSTVDTGNNDYLVTITKSNFPPYGIDFPGRIATGRFSNGKLVPDLLASKLGIKGSIPPFLKPNLSDHELLTGVCFASAGAGLDNLTSEISQGIPMLQQALYLADYMEKLNRIVGERKARRTVEESLVIISAGAVDFLFRFYISPYTRRVQYTRSEYQDFLLNQMQKFIEKLYNLGCRKMAVNGLPPMGCLPVLMTRYTPQLRKCIENFNSECQSYNNKLMKLLQQLQANLTGSTILYVDSYNPTMDMIHNPDKYGFVETARGCCGTGLIEAGPSCNSIMTVCQNRSEFIFWDSLHPTESVYGYYSSILLSELQTQL